MRNEEDYNDDSDSEVVAPPTSPSTPTLYEEDEDIEELVTFTDEFITSIVESILRPVPTYSPCCSNMASESSFAQNPSSQTPVLSEEDKTTIMH